MVLVGENEMHCTKWHGFAAIVVLFFQSVVGAQFSMPLERIDAFGDSDEDLVAAPVNSSAVVSVPTNVFVQDVAALDADYDFAIASAAASVAGGTAETTLEAFTLTPLNSITTVGDLECALTGQLVMTASTNDANNEFGSWEMNFTGTTQYEILPHPDHDPPYDLTLRASLLATAVCNNSVMTGGYSTNRGDVSVEISCSSVGTVISYWAQWNDSTREWEWVLIDRDGPLWGSTPDGFYEEHYEEVVGMQPGDIVTVDVWKSFHGYATGDPNQQLWTASASAWFDIIGQ
jgi:hypothetical protein